MAGDTEEEGSGQVMESILAEMSGEGPSGSEAGSGVEMGSGSGEDESEEEIDVYALEYVQVDEDFYYMAHVLRLMAMLHAMVSLAMLVAYYHLKVPHPNPTPGYEIPEHVFMETWTLRFRYPWLSSSERRKLHGEWSSMVCT